MNSTRFWLIYSPTGPYPPIRKIWSESEAQGICRDMAKRHTGQQFFIMESKLGYVTEDPVEPIFIQDGGVPF